MAAELQPVPPTVGFVGLGMMGSRMAARLARAGVPLVVTNRSEAKSAPVIAAGARWARRPRDVGEAVGQGVVFTMLRDARAFDAMVFGRAGLAKGLRPGSLVIDLSTVRPDESRGFAERLAPQGIHFVDAPVGGSIDAAEAGSLIFYVGGDPAHVERARALLGHLGHELHHLGPVGQGSAMKLVNNLLTIGNIALLAEALAFGERVGLDRARMLELLGRGGGRSTMLERKRTQLLERRYEPQFLLSLARKDLGLVETSARRASASTRLTREVRRMVDEAVRAGHAEEDFSVVLEAALVRGAPAPAPPETASP
jgi:3-hydroxyisobutyrate dehydrogenase-like beta-hydroxyacid dehydrogenase